MYVALTIEIDANSGVAGAPHSHPYEREEPDNPDEARPRALARWSTPLDAVGWRRAWALRNGDEPIGFVELVGGLLRSELHRANIGMGILPSHRRRGGGTMLLDAAIAWAREQPSIAWVDLGVFSDNPGAQALYTQHGFEVVGWVADRFRVEGYSLDDTAMTLDVSATLTQ